MPVHDWTMTSTAFDDVAIIARECGQRTAGACVDLLAELAPGRPIHRVSARPGSTALRESLQLGIRLQQAWTLCIDANVLVLPALADFVREARQRYPDPFAAQALIYDKLLPSRRPAGNHLYRTELIQSALLLIPNDALRPEAAMIQAMATKGFPCHQSRIVVGLHDFEQWLNDIRAKALLYARRHDHLESDYLAIWRAHAELEPDYAAALEAWGIAQESQEAPQVCGDFAIAVRRDARTRPPERPPLTGMTAESVVALYEKAIVVAPADEVPIRHLQAGIDAAVFPIPPRPPRLRRVLDRLCRLRHLARVFGPLLWPVSGESSRERQ
jgi:hypothetical protein